MLRKKSEDMIHHLAHELVSILKRKGFREDLSSALSLKFTGERIGEVADILRRAVQKSSLSMFEGGIYAFDGRIYRKLENVAYNASLAAVMRAIGVSNGDITSKQEQIRRTVFYGVVAKRLDVRKNIICFNNCVLDVYTGKVSKFGRDCHVLYRLDYDYDPEAECPLWEGFLRQMLPDSRVRAVVQEILALPYIDRREAKIEKMFLFYGKGANGKSVIYDIMNDILGKRNVQTFDLGSLVNGDDSKWNVDAVNHSMLDFCSEIDKKTICSSRIKSLISGEGVTACAKGKKPYTARDVPFIIGNVNELPHTVDNTYGFFRRVMVVPFSVTVSKDEEDLRLHDKLRRELPGILNWILAGRERFVRAGYRFTESKIVNDATRWYERNSNPAIAFMMDEGYSVNPSVAGDVAENIAPTELYRRYEEYCNDTLEPVVNSDTFNKTLISKGYRDPRKRYYRLYKTKHEQN